MTTKSRHNHVWDYMQGHQDGCPRCAELKAEKEANGETQHNHARQPFGRHVKGCPRCVELVSGAPAREGVFDRQQRMDRELAEEMRRHFADKNSKCDHMTCYQW
jgi:hypothetical protein